MIEIQFHLKGEKYSGDQYFYEHSGEKEQDELARDLLLELLPKIQAAIRAAHEAGREREQEENKPAYDW